MYLFNYVLCPPVKSAYKETVLLVVVVLVLNIKTAPGRFGESKQLKDLKMSFGEFLT